MPRKAYSINIKEYYPDNILLGEFLDRFRDFVDADPNHKKIFIMKKAKLEYITHDDCYTISSDAPFTLLIFGNPAPHSVIKGVPFSYEGNQRIHRVWKVLKNLGISEKIAITNFFTMPSSASAHKWSGVAGLKKLFGLKVFRQLATKESVRMLNIIRGKQVKNIVILQRDAYESLRSDSMPKYNIKSAFSGSLVGHVANKPVIGIPPTRYFSSTKVKEILVAQVKATL